jgi:two-component system response regulator AtoC
VRELEHTIERAVALASTSVLIPDDLPLDVRGSSSVPDAWPERPKTLEELKSWYVDTILRQTRGNKAQAAEILGIDRRTLYRMLERSATDEDLDEP